jgi:hypothetical protein
MSFRPELGDDIAAPGFVDIGVMVFWRLESWFRLSPAQVLPSFCRGPDGGER